MKTIGVLLIFLVLVTARKDEKVHKAKKNTMKRLRKKITCDEMDAIKEKANNMEAEMKASEDTLENIKKEAAKELEEQKSKSASIDNAKALLEAAKTATSGIEHI